MSKVKNYYKELSELPIKRLVEKKGGLDYLSWSNAWDMLKKIYPNAQRVVYECYESGAFTFGEKPQGTTLNYFTDGKTAYVKVGIIVNDIEHIDYLPVMDFRNKSISVDKITSFDVSKAIQRATAKAIAMHGLGLSLWTGEDIPSQDDEASTIKSITLDVGDDNWEKVLKFVSANKGLGINKLISMLSQKYTVTDMVKKELKKELNK
tara:strand:+ start:1255 stop:1875 length:621 start_codon:yes stop_codon:yes gene_type:complete